MPNAIVVRTLGGPEVLAMEERAAPAPGPGEVQVRVAAVGVNFIDVYHRTGLYPKEVPFVIGLEGAGEVTVVGPGVDGLGVGERVAWARVAGSYADVVTAPADQFVRVPEGIDLETAAAVMLLGMTAHYLTHGTRTTRAGDTVLVHAAAGGVGLLLVQMLAHAGARVLATCSTGEKAELARDAGAAHVIRYTDEDFREEARRLTDGRGVDVVYDSVGRSTFDGSLGALRPRGLLVSYGQSSGPIPAFELGRLASLGSLYITRPSLFDYVASRDALEARASAVLGAVGANELRVRVGQRLALAEAAVAHRALEERRTTGKTLLLPQRC